MKTGNLYTSSVQATFMAAVALPTRRFKQALSRPAQAQANLLKHLVGANRACQYGQAYDFSRIRSVSDFQRLVPITDYETLSPWIQRIADGESRVLTAEDVFAMERSGGTDTPNKLVPYTPGLLGDFSRAFGPWLGDLLRSHPRLHGTRAYMRVAPMVRDARTTASGLRIGLDDTTQFFGKIAAWALKRFSVPEPETSELEVHDLRKNVLRNILAAEDLGLISVWSPTLLTVLMGHLEENLYDVLTELPEPRALEIARAVDKAGGVVGQAIWPRLQVISCWTEGPAAQFVDGLRRFFPETQILSKGVARTEGVVSFTMGSHEHSTLALRSHFLEFIDVHTPTKTPLLAHELKRGGLYQPLISTSGGLYRYKLEDRVECMGHNGATPLIRSAGKGPGVSDLAGEQLNARRVEAGLREVERLLGLSPRFAMLAPVGPHPPKYCLYLETTADDTLVGKAAQELDSYLRSGHHYNNCRELGQLGPICVQRIEDGWNRYRDALMARGVAANDVVPRALDPRLDWSDVFSCEPSPGIGFPSRLG